MLIGCLCPGAELNPRRLARIPARMKQFVEQGTIAGAVTLVQHRGRLASLEAVGYEDLESRRPMRPDTTFYIMSMSKPVTAIGVMILIEEGLVSLADPVEKHLPEFRGQLLAERPKPGILQLRKPTRPITVLDLLTHTSGMGALPPPGMGGADFYFARLDKSLEQAVRLYAQQPLEFDPGTRWTYSNPGIAVLGRIIEVASGQPFEKFMAERVFQPLGMRDTFYFPLSKKREAAASVYEYTGGKLKNLRDRLPKGGPYPMPEGGLCSTAKDVAAWHQMMLDGGLCQGQRILSQASVDAMRTWRARETGGSYGLGWVVAHHPAGGLRLESTGAYGHGGAFGTYAWIDPAKELVGVFLIQRFGGGGSTEVNAFVTLAGAAVEE